MREYQGFESPGPSAPQRPDHWMGTRIVIPAGRPGVDEDPASSRRTNGDRVPLPDVENNQLERTAPGKGKHDRPHHERRYYPSRAGDPAHTPADPRRSSGECTQGESDAGDFDGRLRGPRAYPGVAGKPLGPDLEAREQRIDPSSQKAGNRRERHLEQQRHQGAGHGERDQRGRQQRRRDADQRDLLKMPRDDRYRGDGCGNARGERGSCSGRHPGAACALQGLLHRVAPSHQTSRP